MGKSIAMFVYRRAVAVRRSKPLGPRKKHFRSPQKTSESMDQAAYASCHCHWSPISKKCFCHSCAPWKLVSCFYQGKKTQEMWMSRHGLCDMMFLLFTLKWLYIAITVVVLEKSKSRFKEYVVHLGRPGRNMIGNVPSQLTRQMCEIGGVNVEVEAKSLGFVGVGG